VHGKIGRVLESQDVGQSPQYLSLLAFHFGRSGEQAKGVTYALRAADTAIRAFAAEEGLAHYRVAHGLAAPDDDRRGEILLGLGKAALLADAIAEAASAFEAARVWGLHAGDRVTAARAALGLGRARSGSGTWQAALEAKEVAVALLQDHPGPQLAQALTELASTEALMGKFSDGIGHAERSLELAQSLGNGLLEARARKSLGNLLVLVNDVLTGMQALERALELATAADDPAEAADCCFRLAYATWKTAQLRRCRKVSQAWMDFASRCRNQFQLLGSQDWLASVAVAEGNWRQADRLMADAVPAVERAGYTELRDWFYMDSGWLAYLRGDYGRAEREFLALEASYAKSPEALGRRQGLLGLAQLALGKGREARTYMAEQDALLAALPVGCMPTAAILVCLAVMALLMAHQERRRRYYTSLQAFQGQNHWFLVDWILGAVEVLWGDWQAAEAHLAAAQAMARREGFRPELALVLEGQANLEVARGGQGSAIRARTLLGQALNLSQDIGMTVDAARVRERLRTLSRQPRGSHPRFPAGLSAPRGTGAHTHRRRNEEPPDLARARPQRKNHRQPHHQHLQ
jgi:tetratricopeptide (TPR) repeat protein